MKCYCINTFAFTHSHIDFFSHSGHKRGLTGIFLVSTFAFFLSMLLTPPFSTVFISKRFNVGHISSFSITLDTKWVSMEDFWAEKTDLKPGFQIALQTPFLMRFRLMDTRISGVVRRFPPKFCEYLFFTPFFDSFP